MTTRDDDNARKREIILKCIKAKVEPDAAIAARAGCSRSMVKRVRAEMEGRPQTDKRRKKR